MIYYYLIYIYITAEIILEFFIQTSLLTTDMPPDNRQHAEACSITAAMLLHKNSRGSVKAGKQTSQSIAAAGGQYMH